MGQGHCPAGGDERFLPPPRLSVGGQGWQVSQAPWCWFQGAAIPSRKPGASFVLVIHLSVLMGHLELTLRTSNYLIACEGFYFIPSPDTLRPHPTGVAMDARPLQGAQLWNQHRVLVYDPHGAPVVRESFQSSEIVAVASAVMNKS